MRAACLLAGLLAAAAVPAPAQAQVQAHEEAQFRFGRFGPVRVYQSAVPAPQSTAQVVIFASGDGGWTRGTTAMARELADDGALVLGVDIRFLRAALDRAPDACAYPAADFEALSHYTQRRLGLATYHPPVVAGYSGGATLAYVLLAQAPANTFAGALSLAFCPDLLLAKPLCRGEGLPSRRGRRGRMVYPQPVARVPAPWIALHGATDRACPAAAAERFVSQVAGARFVALPNVGHGFAKPREWAGALRSALLALRPAPPASPPPEAVRNLPLIELPARGGGDVLAVVLSGDGGWASIDRRIGETLRDSGVAVVGLNSLQYFWSRRTPDGAAADLSRILRHYLPAWRKARVALIGYSLGADVLPFLASRLPEDLRRRVALVALAGAGRRAEFEFRLSDWFGGSRDSGLPVAPEVARLDPIPVLCLYGKDERDALCPELPDGAAERVLLQGGHHFGGDYSAIARAILARLRPRRG